MIKPEEGQPDKPKQAVVEKHFSASTGRYRFGEINPAWQILRRRETRAVQRSLGDLTGQSALDLGAGAGFYSRILLKSGAAHVTAVDLSRPMLDLIDDQRITKICADAETVATGSVYPAIVMAGVLEFVPDPDAVLFNAAKHATTGGHLTCLVPMDNLSGRLYRLFHRRHGFSVSLFSPEKMRQLAYDCGWETVNQEIVLPFSIVSSFRRKG
ncbi:MAG: methyltransferase domain-containing protein [Rhodospirillales bacterium]